jgi:hypothetical protein
MAAPALATVMTSASAIESHIRRLLITNTCPDPLFCIGRSADPLKSRPAAAGTEHYTTATKREKGAHRPLLT